MGHKEREARVGAAEVQLDGQHSGQKRRRTLEDSNFARKAKLGSLLALLLGSIGKEGRPMSWSSQSRWWKALVSPKNVRRNKHATICGVVSPAIPFEFRSVPLWMLHK